jgi:hypothetical protein
VTVYVDDWRQPATVGPVTARWSHLTADTTEELHLFAAELGCAGPGSRAMATIPCATTTTSPTELRDEAIARGAVAVTWRQAARARRQRRQSQDGALRSSP